METKTAVHIETTPPGAMVFENGAFTGHETPVTMENVSVGYHTYELMFDYYDEVPHKVTVDVRPGRTETLSVDLSHMAPAARSATAGDQTGSGSETGEAVYIGGPDNSPAPRAMNQAKPAFVPPPGKTSFPGSTDVGIRIAGGFIDSVTITIATTMVSIVGSFVHWGFGMILSQAVAIILFATRDMWFGAGRSLGKVITGTRVLSANGQAPTTEQLVKRNLPFIVVPVITFLASFGYFVPAIGFIFAIISAFIGFINWGIIAGEIGFLVTNDGQRLGDQLASTRVVMNRGQALPPSTSPDPRLLGKG